jgi:hypothetical protein
MESPIAEIETAFDGVKRPKVLTLHVADAHDSSDYSNDKLHRAKDYDGRWQDIPDEHLLSCHWGLSHLGADGLQFYLPAAMTWVLKNFRDSNSFLVDATIYQLACNRDNEKLAEYYDRRFQLFTAAQWHACRSFLEFLLIEDAEGNFIDTAEAQQALGEVLVKIYCE